MILATQKTKMASKQNGHSNTKRRTKTVKDEHIPAVFRVKELP